MKSKVQIEIIGKTKEYFVKECIKEKINIYDLQKDEKKVYIIIEAKDLDKIKKKKTTCQIKIINWYGFLKWKRRMQKYQYWIFFIMLGILCNMLCSQMIWKVEVIHPSSEMIRLISKDLEEYGLQKYHWKLSYEKKEEIKKKILEKEKEKIEWIEIKEIGTKYEIQVEQRKKRKPEEECFPRHIVAKKKAILLGIEASNGEIQKKKNDYVEKGEILISGFIYNKEKIVQKKCAQGKVYGETWYTIIVTIPEKRILRKKTHQKRVGWFFQIKNQTFYQGNPYKHYETKKYHWIKDEIIPISFGLVQYQKMKEEKENYTVYNIDQKALKEAKKSLERKLTEDESILEKKVLKKRKNNSKIEVTVFCRVKENITDYLDIHHLNIEDLNQERE